MKYKIIRDEQDKCVIIKRMFSILAVYSGAWWDESDESIFRDFIADTYNEKGE